MKKKLFALGLSLCLTAGTLGSLSLNRVDAAVKDVSVGGNIFTDNGILNELDWSLKGDTTATSFKEKNKGDVFVPGAAGAICATKPIAFPDAESVKIEIDVFSTDFFTMGPVFANKKQTYEKNSYFYINSTAIDTSPTGSAMATFEYYADEELTTLLPKVGVDGFTAPSTPYYCYVTEANICALRPYPYKNGAETVSPYGTHVEYIIKADKTFGFRSAPYQADGTLDETLMSQAWVPNMFEDNGSGSLWPKNEGTAWYFGLKYATAGTDHSFDNFKVTATMKDPETPADDFEKTVVLGSTDFSGSDWGTTNAVYNDGSKKIYYSPNSGSAKKIQEIEATPANTDRIVTELQVKSDSSVARAFTLNASLDFRTLGKKFGFAFGLQDQMGAVDADGVSYVYFTQGKDEENNDATFVTVMNNGVDGTPVSLGGDYVTGDFYDFSITANRDGTAKLTVGTKTIDLTISNTDGYVAIVTAGEGIAEVGIGASTSVTRFVYRSSDGGTVENNFNTAYVDPDEFEINSTKAVGFVNPDEARGLILEDGKLRFAGTSDGSYLATKNAYADYILEFTVEDYNLQDKPEHSADNREEGLYFQSVLAVNLATKGGSGWASSLMFAINDNYVQLQDFSKTSTPVVTMKSMDYQVRPAETGVTKTSVWKFVVLNNTVSVYVQEVKAGETPSADNYISVGTFEVDDTYGQIAFATTDGGYFNIDNVRVTPIDNPDPAIVEKNLADYVDFKEIADTIAPRKLSAPTVTVDGSTVKWEAVENATGYVVVVDGKEYSVGGSVLSYTLDLEGDYIVSVYAKGDGKTFLNSDECDQVTVSVAANNSGTSSGGSASDSGSGGCGSVTGVAALSLVSAAGAAFVISKKKKSD